MLIAVLCAFWLVFGLANYGMLKGFWKNFYSFSDNAKYVQYTSHEENFVVLTSLLGPFSFVSTLVFRACNAGGGRMFNFCFRMPSNLCEKNKPR